MIDDETLLKLTDHVEGLSDSVIQLVDYIKYLEAENRRLKDELANQ